MGAQPLDTNGLHRHDIAQPVDTKGLHCPGAAQPVETTDILCCVTAQPLEITGLHFFGGARLLVDGGVGAPHDGTHT